MSTAKCRQLHPSLFKTMDYLTYTHGIWTLPSPCGRVGWLIVASPGFLILLSVSLFRQTSAVRSRLCVSVSQRASQRMLHSDTCLYVLITDAYFFPSLASSRPPMALSLPPCLEWAQHRWHKAAWLACHTSIRLWEAAGESKLELNLRSYYSVQADCPKLRKNQVAILY